MTEQSGASREGLTLDSIRNFKILVPPKIEQTKIVDIINANTQIVNKAISANRRAIELLKEFRTTLIAEVEDLAEIEEESAQLKKEETLPHGKGDD